MSCDSGILCSTSENKIREKCKSLTKARQDKIFSFKISEKRREYCLHSKLTISVKAWKRLTNFAITNTAIKINAFISTRSMVLMGW